MTNMIDKQLEILKKQVSGFGLVKIENHLKAFERIGELGTPLDVQYLIPYVFSTRKKIARKAASTIRTLLTNNSVREIWSQLYRHLCYADTFKWLTPKTLMKFQSFDQEDAAHLYGLATLHHDGYTREIALDYLQRLSSDERLPYVLLRLNDWVPEVQAKATEAFINVLPSTPLANIIQCFGLIDWLDKTERTNLKKVKSDILTFIKEPKNRDELLQEMEKISFRERLFCWRILADEIKKNDHLIDRAIKDSAPEVRRWAAEHLYESERFKERLNTLLDDKAARVRQAALMAIPKDNFEEYANFFEIAIFDDSRSIREYARYVLRTNGIENHTHRYRHKIAELKNVGMSPKQGILAGLSETCVQEDIPLLKAYLEHPKSNIRVSALRGLYRLVDEGIDEQLCRGLQDSSAKVRNACVGIMKSGHAHLLAELEDLLENGTSKSQKAAFKVLLHHGPLDSLRSILFLLTQKDREHESMAWFSLDSWYQQNGSRLWFKFREKTYQRTMQLLEQLRNSNIDPTERAKKAWHELPRIMATLKKISDNHLEVRNSP